MKMIQSTNAVQQTDRSANADANQGPFDPSTFRNLIGHFPSGVTVITVAEGENRFGATASAFCSLSLDPPMILVCLHSSIETSRAIARTRTFAVNILGEGQSDVALRFASKTPNKYCGLTNIGDLNGQPILTDSVVQLCCEVEKIEAGGTHSVFIARVTNAQLNSQAPLTYFRGDFGIFSKRP